MEFVTDYKTEQYILNTKWEDFPPEVQEHAVMCGVDLMTALILGSYGKQFEAGERLAAALGMGGDVPVVGSEKRYSVWGATVAMGHSSNSFDIDDGHRMIQGHPGASFVSGVLAAALEQNVSWREYLTTLVICYEISVRWALAMQNHYGYLHSTGAYGAYGTAAGVGRLRGLTEQQLNNALSIADFHAPMTPVMRAVEYPSMNKDGVPFGALIGAVSVLETISGSTGKTHILEMPEYAAHLGDLGEKYHILDLYFKPYTCCRWAHQPIKACIDLLHDNGIMHREIAHATVHTFNSAARLSKKVPCSTDEAQYNIAFPVASALLYGDVGFDQVCEAALANNDVLDMMQRLEFVVDPKMEKEFPARRLAWVELTLKDGTVYTSDVYDAPGEPEDPDLSVEWITKKFKRITRSMMEADRQEQLLGIMTTQFDTPVRDVVGQINDSLKSKRGTV